jgi:hypothetical protein
MRMALALTTLLVVATGCNIVGDNCDDSDACTKTVSKYALDNDDVHSARAKDFVTDDNTVYTLVRIDYGAYSCDELDDEDTLFLDDDDEDCGYSMYCAMVVDNVDYPLEFDFRRPQDALFDPASICGDEDPEDCDLPGYELDVFDDDEFDDWAYEAFDDEDALADCIEDY